MSLKFNLPWDELTFVRAYISIIFAIIRKERKEILIVWIRFTDNSKFEVVIRAFAIRITYITKNAPAV